MGLYPEGLFPSAEPWEGGLDPRDGQLRWFDSGFLDHQPASPPQCGQLYKSVILGPIDWGLSQSRCGELPLGLDVRPCWQPLATAQGSVVGRTF